MKAHPEALVASALPEAHLCAHCFAALLALRCAHLQHTVRHKACSAAPALLPLRQRSRRRPLGEALALRQHAPQVGRWLRATAPNLQNRAPLLSPALWAAVSLEVSGMVEGLLERKTSAAG